MYCACNAISIILTYPHNYFQGKVLWFHCGFKTPLRQLFEICGSKKSILLDDVVLPRETPSSYELTSTTLTAHDLVTVFGSEKVDCSNSPPHVRVLVESSNGLTSALTLCVSFHRKYFFGKPFNPLHNVLMPHHQGLQNGRATLWS